MAAPKYKQYVQQMIEANAALFVQFRPIHDAYVKDRRAGSEAFHREGARVMEVLRDWEQRLCAGIERGQNSVYSMRLSEKFWAEVKKHFSHIELIGVRSSLER